MAAPGRSGKAVSPPPRRCGRGFRAPRGRTSGWRGLSRPAPSAGTRKDSDSEPSEHVASSTATPAGRGRGRGRRPELAAAAGARKAGGRRRPVRRPVPVRRPGFSLGGGEKTQVRRDPRRQSGIAAGPARGRPGGLLGRRPPPSLCHAVTSRWHATSHSPPSLAAAATAGGPCQGNAGKAVIMTRIYHNHDNPSPAPAPQPPAARFHGDIVTRTRNCAGGPPPCANRIEIGENILGLPPRHSLESSESEDAAVTAGGRLGHGRPIKSLWLAQVARSRWISEGSESAGN